MARNALSALGGLEILEVDSFLFISDEADPRAERGGANATSQAAFGLSQAGFGLETASLAPDGLEVPLGADGPPEFSLSVGRVTFDHGNGSFGGAGTSGSITLLEPQLFAAKGGIPGPPSDSGGGGGDDGGDGGDDGGGVLTNYFSGDADGDAGYDIWIEFKGSFWTVELQEAFIQAADYLTTIITDDIGGGGRYRGKIIDDLYVSAELMEIDGTSGVLGRAGPTAVWTANDLTATGVMEFDIADVGTFFDLGLWDDIVMHELTHVLGFGTLWDYGRHDGLVENYQYTGTNALDAYNEAIDSGAGFIPVESDGGSGTAGGHWDEGTLDNELMTGYIDGENYLSKFSVMALADLGYVVDYQDYPNDDYTHDTLIA